MKIFITKGGRPILTPPKKGRRVKCQISRASDLVPHPPKVICANFGACIKMGSVFVRTTPVIQLNTIFERKLLF